VADLGLLQVISHKPCSSLVHPGSSRANPWRVEGSHCVQANDSGRLGALLRGGRLRGPNRLGNLATPGSLGRAFGWPLSARNIRSVRSPKKTTDIQRAMGRLVDELPEEGFTPKLVDSYWAKGAAIVVCHDESTKDWLAARVLALVAWEGSRLKLVGLVALPTYKRVVAWFPGPAEDAEQYLWLRRLNQGLDTGRGRVYERREGSNGVRLVLIIDTASVSVLERLRWRPFSGVGQVTFSLLGAKLEGKK